MYWTVCRVLGFLAESPWRFQNTSFIIRFTLSTTQSIQLIFCIICCEILIFNFRFMEQRKDASLCKKTDQFYKFRLYHIEIINPAGNLIRKLPCPLPRSGHRIVYYKGNIFAFGGFSPRDPVTDELIGIDLLDSRRLFKELWKFNVATKSWINIKTSGTMPTELVSHAAILVENCMLVYGGTGYPFGHSASNSTHLCNLDSLEWFTLSTTGSRPQPLYGQAIALYDNKLYVVGGTTGFAYSMSVHCLDLYTKIWTRLDVVRKDNPNVPPSRYRHGIAILEDKIFIFGGGTSSDIFSFNEIPTFCLTNKIWTVTVTTTTSVFPEPRKCLDSVQVKNDVYICGGHNGRETIYSDIWKINLKQLQWTKLKVELPIPLYFHSIAVSPEGQLFIFGGVTNTEEEIRTNNIYSVWLKMPSLSEICWQAILSYIPDIAVIEKRKLYKLGVPPKYLQLIDFYTNNKRKRKRESY